MGNDGHSVSQPSRGSRSTRSPARNPCSFTPRINTPPPSPQLHTASTSRYYASSSTLSRQSLAHIAMRPPSASSTQSQPGEAEVRTRLGTDEEHSSDRLTDGEDCSMPTTSEFVRKLYKLLENKSLANVVCWGPEGDFFIIKDVDTFTRNILPRTFKHSNFASFVRQLNKYDFHKIRMGDDNPYGENSWLFQHSEFHAGGLDALENIKRKVPGNKRFYQPGGSQTLVEPGAAEDLQVRIEQMSQQQDALTAYIRNLECDYVNVVDGIVNLQRDFAQQDGTIRQLVDYLLQREDGGTAS